MRRVLMVSLVLSIAWPAVAASLADDVAGSGSAFYVNKDGWAVTNAHVVEGCERISVSGSNAEVAEQKLDTQNDLAAVRIGGGVTSVIPLRTKGARLGEEVAAFGYPLANVLSSSIKVTTGNVNSLLGLGDDTRYLQISAPLQPGNSGGPLVDEFGNLLGVNTAVLKNSAAGEDITAQNVNFAIRTSVVTTFLESRSISFEPGLDATAPAPSTADIAEKVQPAVIQLLCHKSKPQKAVLPKQIAPASGGRYFTRLENQDVIGFDYLTLPSVSESQCIQACRSDYRCSAVTYNKRERFCFLKNGAALTVRNSDASASVSSEVSADIVSTGFYIRASHDLPGGDYLHLRNSSFVGCFVACAKDDRCRAFSFIRKKSSCWLKDSITTAKRAAGVDLGIK